MQRSKPSKTRTPRRTPLQEVEWIERVTAEAMAAGTYAETLDAVRRARARSQDAVAADRDGAALGVRIRVAEAVLVAALERENPDRISS